MKIKSKISVFLAILLVLTGLYVPNQLSRVNAADSLDKIDMSKWSYNSSAGVYYQVGINYCANPVDTTYETMGIFVPEAYMTGTANSDGTYTCTLNSSGTVNGYTASTAPMVIPVNTSGYSAQAAPTSYSSNAATYTAEGFIYVYPGCRGRDHGAPTGVTDLKAAIRYVRYNSGSIPGNPDAIFTFGHSGGGAQSALVGATGNSALYDDYLDAIGAVSQKDNIAGSMCWCPITNLDQADEAYEWNMGLSRSASGDDLTLSKGLAAAFAEYINALGLKDSSGSKLTLSSSSDGYYQSGSYNDYIISVIETSLNNYLSDNTSYGGSSSSSGGPGGSGGGPGGSFSASSTSYTSKSEYVDYLNTLGNGNWVSYDSSTETCTITSVEDFAAACKNASKGLGAFDNITSKSQAENTLFGTDGNGGTSHFDSILAELIQDNSTYKSYYSDFTSDLAATDSLGKSVATRLNMYNPMYYLDDYYDGYKTADVAPYFRIRTGITQGDTAVNTEINLALALENYGSDVDFATVWNEGHSQAERTGSASANFIAWVNDCVEDMNGTGGSGGSGDSEDTEDSDSATSLSGASITLNSSTAVYTGSEITPVIKSVTLNGVSLTEGTDYEVTATGAITNAGTSYVKIKGINKYKDTISAAFTVTKASVTFKNVSRKVKASKLKKKAISYSVINKSGGGAVTVTKYGSKKAKKYVSVNKNGKVKIKKGAGKGTYKVTIAVAATDNYKKTGKTLTVKVK